jgi:uncharacterized protein YndB with AHSA1/START domain
VAERTERLADDETSVRFEIDVEAPIEHVFRVFSEGFDSWWPRDHHIGEVDMAVAILEPRIGGRWYELGVDGSESDWGTVLAWDPPRHVAVSWHLDGTFRFDPWMFGSSRAAPIGRTWSSSTRASITTAIPGAPSGSGSPEVGPPTFACCERPYCVSHRGRPTPCLVVS